MTIPSADKPSSKLTSLVGLLDHAVSIVPAAGYLWGVVAAGVTVAIITILIGLRWLSFAAIVAVMILGFIFYIFSRIEKSSDTVVKLLGYCLLIVTTLA
ncbi:MAG TPA: hypothetical protein VNF04_18700, partial [Stellaceae bacterium]|nr:hypothetical protein [Stellaceae bacterium]